MRTNYHTHTTRCQHATGTEREYIEAAIKSQYNLLGFSDHTPWPFPDGYVSRVRMCVAELEGYLATIRALACEYADVITIKAGLECEYFPEYTSWMEDRLNDKRAESRVDYVILGQHYDTNEVGGAFFGASASHENAERYVRQVVEGMRTGLYACVAHPDIILLCVPEFDRTIADFCREICRASRELSVPLEYNLYGLRKQARPYKTENGWLGYPNDHFWKIAAEEGCQTIIGVDAHDPAHLADPELGLLAGIYLRNLGVKVIDQLDV